MLNTLEYTIFHTTVYAMVYTIIYTMVYTMGSQHAAHVRRDRRLRRIRVSARRCIRVGISKSCAGVGGADPDGDSVERPGRWARQGSATRRDAAATRMMRRLGCGGDSDDGGGDAAAAAARIRITELTPGPAGPPAGPGPGRGIRHP